MQQSTPGNTHANCSPRADSRPAGCRSFPQSQIFYCVQFLAQGHDSSAEGWSASATPPQISPAAQSSLQLTGGVRFCSLFGAVEMAALELAFCRVWCHSHCSPAVWRLFAHLLLSLLFVVQCLHIAQFLNDTIWFAWEYKEFHVLTWQH